MWPAVASLETRASSHSPWASSGTAADLGITAVPTYVLASTWSIPGAQDADTFAAVMRRAAAALAGGAP